MPYITLTSDCFLFDENSLKTILKSNVEPDAIWAAIWAYFLVNPSFHSYAFHSFCCRKISGVPRFPLSIIKRCDAGDAGDAGGDAGGLYSSGLWPEHPKAPSL
jgi:hypothetical protein